jgi:Holliday junction resolvase RusA-like endonuclease
MAISFRVDGIPQPQGSKKALPNRATGRAMMVDANAKAKPWMAAVSAEAAQAMDGGELLQGPLGLTAYFKFPRPKSHYRTGKNAHLLSERAPADHDKKPDCDKLIRAIGDAMTGIVYHDDAQIAQVFATKTYGPAGVLILVSKLLSPPTEATDERDK